MRDHSETKTGSTDSKTINRISNHAVNGAIDTDEILDNETFSEHLEHGKIQCVPDAYLTPPSKIKVRGNDIVNQSIRAHIEWRIAVKEETKRSAVLKKAPESNELYSQMAKKLSGMKL